MTSKLVEAGKIFEAALNGDYMAQGRIKSIVTNGTDGLSEALTTSDLARTFNSINRESVEAQYAALPTTWTDFAKRNTLQDFKPEYYREFLFNEDQELESNGGQDTAPGSLPLVPELTEYPTFKFTTGKSQIQLHKNGARVPFSWEAVINDEWSFIQSLPGQLAVYAKNTEETEAVRILASKTGPNTAVFKGVTAPDTRPLTLDNLKAVKTEIRNRKVNGNYVTVNKFRLVVPTTLRDWAEELLKISQIQRVSGVGTSEEVRTTVQTGNSDVSLTVNDWLTKVDKSANAATTWYLVPDGGSDGTRDSILVNFLKNHERPEFRQSGNTGLYLGGGAVPSLEGSLLNDDVEYRVRHVVAGGTRHTDALYASTGTGQ